MVDIPLPICYHNEMYAAYLKERERAEILETNYGFAVVKQMPDCLYLQDIYVKPEFRKSGKGRELLLIVEDAAREMGFKKVLGSCCPEAYGSTNSLKAILACGFELHSCEKGVIYLMKELV